ncbi:branched-chain amino acid ABC transporter, permease [Deferribacter desulfuricans SSM1]|uniref:Branched-chain amino acid ABC transporter, permease n=1 Tax=Deferribacter desulfuricans (strain DSM 14783 / JCM 11476 / NBRC 101012 / SSM1) TaxID=639282 RepID=D3PCW0_DEFDS|nr:branched-chain amino acid ABC transporter permease [Deferribacter desulfuricans]BAI80433.1 branched-chain amino acid ABC transporter, permease [Deferribacter desulfuricans SSM1]
MQFLYSGLTTGSIYVLVAIGFNIIYNTTGIVNFAQGEFVMIGGMLIYTALSLLEIPTGISFLLTIVGSYVLGILTERIFLNNVKLKTEINLITITLAVAIILRGSAMIIWGRDSLKVAPYINESVFKMPGGVITTSSLLVILVSIIIAVILSLFFKFSKYGKAFRACHNDPYAALNCGISVNKIKMLSFAIAGSLGGIAGILITPITFVTYNDGIMTGLKGFSAAVLGGLGSFTGAITGGYLLAILEGFFATILPSGYKDAFAFIILLIILFVLPNGLFGKKRADRI